MKVISILDTTISDYNLGNQIIMEAVNDILDELFWDDFMFRLQYAERFGRQSLRQLNVPSIFADQIFIRRYNLLLLYFTGLKSKHSGYD